MTDIRELLTLAARAMGYTSPIQRTVWNPDTNSGDSHDMCAALMIDTKWIFSGLTEDSVSGIYCDAGSHFLAEEKLADHNGDKSAAWRLAALRVAADIGKGMK